MVEINKEKKTAEKTSESKWSEWLWFKNVYVRSRSVLWRCRTTTFPGVPKSGSKSVRRKAPKHPTQTLLLRHRKSQKVPLIEAQMFYFSVNFSHVVTFLFAFTLWDFHFVIWPVRVYFAFSFLHFLDFFAFSFLWNANAFWQLRLFPALTFLARERQYLVPYGRNTKNYAAFCVSLAPAKNLRNLKILIFFIYVPDGWCINILWVWVIQPANFRKIIFHKFSLINIHVNISGTYFAYQPHFHMSPLWHPNVTARGKNVMALTARY